MALIYFLYVPVAGPPLRLEVDVSAKAVGEGASHELGLVSEHFVDNELHYRTEQGGREIRSRIDVEFRLLGRIPQSQMLRLLHKLIDLHGRIQVEASLPARAQAARPRAVRNEVGLALGGVAPGSFGAHVVHDPRCVAPAHSSTNAASSSQGHPQVLGQFSSKTSTPSGLMYSVAEVAQSYPAHALQLKPDSSLKSGVSTQIPRTSELGLPAY